MREPGLPASDVGFCFRASSYPRIHIGWFIWRFIGKSFVKCLSAYPSFSVCLSACLSDVYLNPTPSHCLSLCRSTHLCPTVCQFVRPSLCLCVCPVNYGYMFGELPLSVILSFLSLFLCIYHLRIYPPLRPDTSRWVYRNWKGKDACCHLILQTDASCVHSSVILANSCISCGAASFCSSFSLSSSSLSSSSLYSCSCSLLLLLFLYSSPLFFYFFVFFVVVFLFFCFSLFFPQKPL